MNCDDEGHSSNPHKIGFKISCLEAETLASGTRTSTHALLRIGLMKGVRGAPNVLGKPTTGHPFRPLSKKTSMKRAQSWTPCEGVLPACTPGDPWKEASHHRGQQERANPELRRVPLGEAPHNLGVGQCLRCRQRRHMRGGGGSLILPPNRNPTAQPPFNRPTGKSQMKSVERLSPNIGVHNHPLDALHFRAEE